MNPYDKTMSDQVRKPKRPMRLWRAVVEVAFIVFLFYANLLMGEYTRSNGQDKTFAAALHNIVTGTNFGIALISGLIGYVVFEALRERL